LPPGTYTINNTQVVKDDYWALNPVKRVGHMNGIAPYSGIVAVTQNSFVISNEEANTEPMKAVCRECEKAAKVVQAKTVIRIDCRFTDKTNSLAKLFDLNMKVFI